MKMLRKVIDCESLDVSQENVHVGVYFSKVKILQCGDCNSSTKRLHHRFVFGISIKNLLP